jgi:hypothetical protein
VTFHGRHFQLQDISLACGPSRLWHSHLIASGRQRATPGSAPGRWLVPQPALSRRLCRTMGSDSGAGEGDGQRRADAAPLCLHHAEHQYRHCSGTARDASLR